MAELTTEQKKRYARQIMLERIGTEGQRKLLASRVLIIGTGGLGSPAAYYLAAAGVGTLGIMDQDVVDVSNLQRQILHSTPDIGRGKTVSAGEKLRRLSPDTIVVEHAERLTPANAMDIVGSYDIVVDCCDNFPTRYLACDVCMILGRPYVFGSVYQFEGQASIFVRGETPCYRCLFPIPPAVETMEDPARLGIMGVVTGVIGSVQAAEAVKCIVGVDEGSTLRNRLLMYDALGVTMRHINVARAHACPVCGDAPRIVKPLADYEKFCRGGRKS